MDRFIDKLNIVYNSKGMAAKSSYAIWNENNQYVAFDALGAEVAVKAIWSAMQQGRSGGKLSYKESHRNDQITKLEDASYAVSKTAVFKNPIYHRWHFHAEVPKNAAFTYIYGYTNDAAVIEDQFYLAMQKSIYPIQKDWTSALIARGLDDGIVTEMHHTQSVKFAYEIVLAPWQEVIHTMILAGDIQVSQLKEAA